MKNVTKIFRKVISSHTDWMVNSFYNVLEVLKSKGSGITISFWDGDENWASILTEQKTVGYIWRKYPLIVLEKNIENNLKFLLKEFDIITYIKVNFLDKDLLKIDDPQLIEFLDGFNHLNSFTIEDLWFNTNT